MAFEAGAPLTGTITECTGVDQTAITVLANQGVLSTHQLIGLFLSCERDCAAFEQMLTGCTSAARISNAVACRVAHIGVKIPVKLPTDIDGKPISSKIDDVKAQQICRRVFCNDLRHDFEGCGLGKPSDSTFNKGMQGLHANGITTTNKLYGEMLRHFDGPPTKEMVVRFWKRLGQLGVSHGYKSTMVDAMLQKLDIGLENQAVARMERVDDVEEPPEAPGTGGHTRRTSRLPPGTPPPFRGPDPPSPRELPPSPEKVSSSCFMLSIAVVILGVVVAAYVSTLRSAALTLGPPQANLVELEHGEWL